MRTTEYKGYTVYEDGNIAKKIGTGFIKGKVSHRGYLQNYFSENGIQYLQTIHRFVWEAFNGEVPEGYEIDHIDDDKTNNRLDNLQLLTKSENISKSRQSLSKKQIELILYLKANTNYSSYEIAEEVGTSQSTVMRIIQNPRFAYVY